MTTISGAPGSAFYIFRNRNFSLLWFSQLLTEMGTSITALASAIYVYRLTGSTLNVGLMMMATAAPSLLVGLVAGVFVDRYDRKRIMVLADLLRAALILAIPFLLPFNIAWLYILVALSSTVSQFFNPAHASVLPDIASEEELNAANAMMAVSSFGSLAIGYAAAGLITSRFSIEWAFYIDGLTFFISAVLISLVRIPPAEIEDETNVASVVENLRAGIRAIGATPIVRSLFYVFVPIFVTFGFLNTLRLPFTIHVLQGTEFEFGLLESVTLIGFVAASLLMARLGDRLREGQWLVLSFLGMGLTGITFALTSAVPMALVIITIEGFVNAPSVIARSLVIQRHVPRVARGRVFSAFFVMRDVMFMAGMALAGLADLLDVRLLYLAGGIIVLAVGLLTLAMPGLGQPAADETGFVWRHALNLLRMAPAAPGLGIGRRLLPADYDRLVALLPALANVPQAKQARLRSAMSLIEAPAGTAIVRRHETSDAAYFILEGGAVAGWNEDGRHQALERLQEGDFFGEIAALTGIPRTADVITEQPSRLIKVTANTLRDMASDPQLNRIFLSRMTERMMRMNMIDVARPGHFDQAMLRELRTPAPA